MYDWSLRHEQSSSAPKSSRFVTCHAHPMPHSVTLVLSLSLSLAFSCSLASPSTNPYSKRILKDVGLHTSRSDDVESVAALPALVPSEPRDRNLVRVAYDQLLGRLLPHNVAVDQDHRAVHQADGNVC